MKINLLKSNNHRGLIPKEVLQLCVVITWAFKDMWTKMGTVCFNQEMYHKVSNVVLFISILYNVYLQVEIYLAQSGKIYMFSCSIMIPILSIWYYRICDKPDIYELYSMYEILSWIGNDIRDTWIMIQSRNWNLEDKSISMNIDWIRNKTAW